MAHLPTNHPARPFLRVLAVLIGLYILAFGIVGFVVSSGEPVFSRGDLFAMGLRTNLAFSLLSIVAGVVMVAAVVAGRNYDHYLALGGGVVFLGAGVLMMTLLHTEANLLNFAMPTVIVSILIGLTLLWIGLYTRSGPPEVAEAEERFRHSQLGQREYDEAVAGKRLDPPGGSAAGAER